MVHLINVRQVAQILNVSIDKVYRLTANHEIPVIKIGACCRFRPEDIERWIEAKKYGNEP